MATDEDGKYIKALLMCALEGKESGSAILILNRAGFSNPEIAELVGMNAGAVQMRIQRAKASKKKGRTK